MADKSSAAKREETTLAFWNERKIFEQSLSKDAPKGAYVFYDGPPFATGTPHYGHIVASVIKDAVPRYFTMQGYRVPRQWGWDCHGLPIENIVEKELGFRHKKDIVAFGIAKFNEACRSKVLMYVDEWKKVIPRIGRWADMDNPYFTMSRDFMESVWWAFKTIYDKGLVYEDYRSMHICPRCETTLSQSEVTEGYKDVKDLAVTVKFKLKNPEKLGLSGDVYMLAWTTTPWTLPGNVALAVGADIQYATWSENNETYIAASEYFKNSKKEVVVENVSLTGKDLVGLEYEPPFDYYTHDEHLKNRENGWKVYAADFVTADEGTGIAHEAPAFGADDWELAKKYNLPFIQHVNFDGTFKPEVKDFAGEDLSPRAKNIPEEVREVDLSVAKYLEKKGLLFSKEKYLHAYPHCWRCDTPLLNYATSSWFVKVEAQKVALLENAKPINWSPEHIKRGRWGRWLEGARDWSISRQRFWASVIPLWRCVGENREQRTENRTGCGNIRVFGSAAQLEQAAGVEVEDLHKHIVDTITFPCDKCGGEMHRIPDVLDTWFDSGSMPYGQAHYVGGDEPPSNFPAQFIAEGQDQTRAWFYYLHVMATSLFDRNAFENVIVNGIVLAEDGKKMSKKLKNYPDPMEVVEKYGADALRLYLLASPVVSAENLNFSEKGVAEVAKKDIGRLNNVLAFYEMYEDGTPRAATAVLTGNILDRWILAELRVLEFAVTHGFETYRLDKAVRPIAYFVDDLSTWYLRRSRDRFKTEGTDKQMALSTLRFVLYRLSVIIAPIAPFYAEHLFQSVREEQDPESVHLDAWPYMGQEEHAEDFVGYFMSEARKIVSFALQKRDLAKIKVRQPLLKLEIPQLSGKWKWTKEVLDVIAEEVNVKEIVIADDLPQGEVRLDTTITDTLQEEGMLRDLIREIQAYRKEKGMKPGDQTDYKVPSTYQQVFVEKHRHHIEKTTNTRLELNLEPRT